MGTTPSRDGEQNTGAQWQFEEAGRWKDMSPRVSRSLTKQKKSGTTSCSLKFNDCEYSYNFASMKQMNKTTKFKRNIRPPASVITAKPKLQERISEQPSTKETQSPAPTGIPKDGFQIHLDTLEPVPVDSKEIDEIAKEDLRKLGKDAECSSWEKWKVDTLDFVQPKPYEKERLLFEETFASFGVNIAEKMTKTGLAVIDLFYLHEQDLQAIVPELNSSGHRKLIQKLKDLGLRREGHERAEQEANDLKENDGTRELFDKTVGRWSETFATTSPELEKLKLELKKNGVNLECLEESRAQFNNLKKSLKNQEMSRLVGADEVLGTAINLYTSNAVYKQLNASLRDGNSNYEHLAVCLNSALRHLDYYWTTVYRGEVFLKDFEVGKLVALKGFTSTSKSKQEALRFLRFAKKELKKEGGTLLEIHSLSGRSVEHISCFKKEQEVLVPAFSLFRVTEVIESENPRRVKMDEVPVLKGGKHVIWVDDEPQNNKGIMEACEKNNIGFVPLKSTREAVEFFSCHQEFLKEPISKFRICSDMTRKEDEIWNNSAGIDLITFLRDVGYKQQILIYVFDVSNARNKIKTAVLENVNVTATSSVTEKHCLFETEIDEVESARSDIKKIHYNYTCDGCDTWPLIDFFWNCEACASSYDLCRKCYLQRDQIHEKHVGTFRRKT